MYYNVNNKNDVLNNRLIKSNKETNTDEYLDVDSEDIENVNQEFNSTSSFLTHIKGFDKNNLKEVKKERKALSNDIYDKNTPVNRNRSSLIDELKIKLPDMVPKNMMTE